MIQKKQYICRWIEAGIKSSPISEYLKQNITNKKFNFKALIRLFARGWRRTRTLAFFKRRWRTQEGPKFYKQYYPPQDLEFIFNLAVGAHKILKRVKGMDLNEMQKGMVLALDCCKLIVRTLSQPRLFKLTEEDYEKAQQY